MSIFQDIARIEEDNFSDAWSEQSLEKTFDYDYNHLIMHKKDGRVVGYIIYSDVQGEAELLRIAVDKRYRRQGIATQLMNDMLEELSGAETETITLEVRAHNISAVALYKKFGFAELYVRPNYYHEPEDDALIFQLILGTQL